MLRYINQEINIRNEELTRRNLNRSEQPTKFLARVYLKTKRKNRDNTWLLRKKDTYKDHHRQRNVSASQDPREHYNPIPGKHGNRVYTANEIENFLGTNGIHGRMVCMAGKEDEFAANGANSWPD